MAKIKRKVKKATGPNMLFPGLPGYHGPDKGWFAWVHHGKLFEHTDYDGDSIKARVAYVKTDKPKDERRIRLAHIMYLGSYLGRKLSQRRTELNNTVGGARVEHDPVAIGWVMDYIAKHKPRNKWDASRCNHGSLMKADGSVMTG